MRRVVVLMTLAIGVANAGTVYKTQARVADGTSKKLVVLDDKPNRLLPACRCVVGTWKLGSETSTHFVGTLQDASFNHARPSAHSFDVKVRKTRELMGMHRDYRATLHGILRDTGQLVLREVSGGEWEVVGYASDPLGKLFDNNTEWNADPRHPPKPAQPSPIVDPDADAAALAKLINDYRASIKLPRVAISAALTKVAQAHVHDLNVNKPVKQGCNQHSWSENGSWTACCYDGSTAASRCMWVKPKEVASYRGKGYEIAANAAGITPERALELWQQSRAHHEVMTNQGIWTNPWRAMGVAIDGDYAVAWFGEEK
jgi:hypothetical protein